jgi:hypothetical protein
MCRLATLSLRLAWSLRPTDVRLGLAASIFVSAGTVLLYIVNLVFTMRIVGYYHPRIGASAAFRIFARVVLVMILITLALAIITVCQAAYTLNASTHDIDRKIQLYAITFNAGIAALPLVAVPLAFIFGHRPPSRSKLGPTSARRRIMLVLLAALLLTLRAAWICGTIWLPPASIQDPMRWYLSKQVFYTLVLLPELMVVYIWALGRVDRWFHVNSNGNFGGSPMESTTSSPGPSSITKIFLSDEAEEPGSGSFIYRGPEQHDGARFQNVSHRYEPHGSSATRGYQFEGQHHSRPTGTLSPLGERPEVDVVTYRKPDAPWIRADSPQSTVFDNFPLPASALPLAPQEALIEAGDRGVSSSSSQNTVGNRSVRNNIILDNEGRWRGSVFSGSNAPSNRVPISMTFPEATFDLVGPRAGPPGAKNAPISMAFPEVPSVSFAQIPTFNASHKAQGTAITITDGLEGPEIGSRGLSTSNATNIGRSGSRDSMTSLPSRYSQASYSSTYSQQPIMSGAAPASSYGRLSLRPNPLTIRPTSRTARYSTTIPEDEDFTEPSNFAPLSTRGPVSEGNSSEGMKAIGISNQAPKGTRTSNVGRASYISNASTTVERQNSRASHRSSLVAVPDLRQKARLSVEMAFGKQEDYWRRQREEEGRQDPSLRNMDIERSKSTSETV